MEKLDKIEEIELRHHALKHAIRARVGYSDEYGSAVDVDKIVEAAKKFETFLKGENNV